MARKKREEISLFCGSRINAAKPHGACILAYMRRENLSSLLSPYGSYGVFSLNHYFMKPKWFYCHHER